MKAQTGAQVVTTEADALERPLSVAIKGFDELSEPETRYTYDLLDRTETVSTPISVGSLQWRTTTQTYGRTRRRPDCGWRNWRGRRAPGRYG